MDKEIRRRGTVDLRWPTDVEEMERGVDDRDCNAAMDVS